ncbi:MAG TPA: TolC family protein [Bryobacteraceae bacterium]|jgi:outer membrane protein TolC|nr:TolC family protein [Bryobacteraceae bacterium]
MMRGLVAGVLCAFGALQAQPAANSLPDYSKAVPTISIFKPYLWRPVQGPDLSNGKEAPLEVQDGKLRLSMEQLVAAVVENNLTVASARYYPWEGQTDLLRARSGSSPRGVDATTIPSGVFAGAVGGSILSSAGGGGGGSSNPGGITGAAGRVSISPSGLFDPSIRLSYSLDRTSSPLNSLVVAGVPSVTNNTGAFSWSYVQAFSSGTSFTVAYSTLNQKSTQKRLLFDPDFTNGFTATVSQQLLNGFGFAVNRALIKVAENEQKIERESFRQQAETALAGAKNAYWDLVAARESVRAAQAALDAAQQLASDDQKQLDAGTMAPLDVQTAQSQAAASRRDLIIAQTNLQNAELAVKATISKNLGEPFASAEIEPTDSFPDPAQEMLPSLREATAIAQAHRPEIPVALGNIQSQKDAMPFIRNAMTPNVNVFALVTTVGLYNVYGTSLWEAVRFKYPEVAVGVTVSFNLRNRQAQADEVRSRLEMNQSQDTLVRTKSQIDVDVQNALIGMTNSNAQVKAAEEAVRSAKETLDGQQKKLNAGLATPYDVVLAQRDWLSAQLAEVQARDSYAKAKVAWDLALGLTLDASHVSLDEMLAGRVSTR